MNTIIREDLNNDFPWTRIEETFDQLNGEDVLVSRFTLFDDGVEKFEAFENGLRRSTEQQDNPGAFGSDGERSWTSILTNFDENGALQDRTTVFDNGIEKFETFDAGVRRSTEQKDNPGAFGSDGAKSWTSILTNFDENGALQDRSTVFDNGVAKFEAFDAGVRRSTEQQDNPGAFGSNGAKSWESILTNFDDVGVVQDRTTIFDNGVQKFEAFENGLKRSIEQVDNPGGFGGPGAKSWETITTNFDDAGLLQDRTTIFDDGVQKFETFENGIRRSIEQIDNPGGFGDPGAKNWQSIVTNFDENGVIQDRTTIFDDGREKRELFEDGRVVSIDVVPQTGSGQQGSQTAFVYDDNGVLIGKIILKDDGTETREFFLDGELRQRIEIDEGVEFPGDQATFGSPSTIPRQFDETFLFSGLTPLPAVISDFPNDVDTGAPPDLPGPDTAVPPPPGTFNPDPFGNGPTDDTFGTPSTPPEPTRDDFDSVGDGVKSWTAKVTTFGDDGKVQSRFTLRDNDIEQRDIFNEGALRQRLESDLPNIGQAPDPCVFIGDCPPETEPEPDFFGAVVWTNRLTEWDAGGNRLLQLTEFDDTDIDALLFTDNIGTQRQEFDGDDDQPWLVRVTDLGSAGDTITLYNEGDTLPDDVIVVPPEAPEPPGFDSFA